MQTILRIALALGRVPSTLAAEQVAPLAYADEVRNAGSFDVDSDTLPRTVGSAGTSAICAQ